MKRQDAVTAIRKFLFGEPAIPILALASLLSAVFLYNSHKEKMQMANEAVSLRAKFESIASLQVGDMVPSVDAMDLNAAATGLFYQEKEKYLLFVFSSGCHACNLQDKSVWNRVAFEAKSRGYIIRGISLDSLQETKKFLQLNKLDFDILIPDNKLFARSYRVRSIPQILVISGPGKVQLIHDGTITLSAMNDLIAKIDSLSQPKAADISANKIGAKKK